MAKPSLKRYTEPRKRRAVRVRGSLAREILDRPRLTVTRSNKYIYAQIVDMASGKTVAGVRQKDPAEAGKMIAEKAMKQKITKVVYDRGSYKYHGQIKALAESARKSGLEF